MFMYYSVCAKSHLLYVGVVTNRVHLRCHLSEQSNLCLLLPCYGAAHVALRLEGQTFESWVSWEKSGGCESATGGLLVSNSRFNLLPLCSRARYKHKMVSRSHLYLRGV